MADMPEEITHAAHAVAGRIYYHCGGYIGKHPGGTSNRCYGFDIDNNKWFSIPDLPGERAGGAMFYIESMNSLLYSGGARRSRPGLRDAVDFEDSWMLYLDDLERGWVVKAPLPNPRNHIAGICVRGRYFFIGGQHGEDERRGNQASTEEYIPSEDKWVTRADMPLNLGHFTSAAVAHQNGIVIVAGSTRFITLVDEVMYYHIGSDTWHVLGTYPRLAKSVVCGSRRGTVYCATGQGSRGVPQDDGWYIKLSKFRTRVAM